MSERTIETEFLIRLIDLNDTHESRQLGEKIVRIQREEHCVQRAVWLMAFLATLAATVFAYETILRESLRYDESSLVLKILCSFGLATLVCFLVFVALLLSYRRKSNLLRQECRRLITNRLESRLDPPHNAPSLESASPGGAFEDSPAL